MKIKEKGQSLFEVLISLGVSAVIIVSLVSLVSSAIRNSNFSKNKNIAARYAEETTEWLRNQRDADITLFKTYVASGVWCLPGLTWVQSSRCEADDKIVGTNFYREVFFDITTVGSKSIIEATVVVFWQDSQGLHEVSSSTSFSDWRQR